MKKLEQLGISPVPWIEKEWVTSDDWGHDVADRNHRIICDMRLLQGETRIPNARLIAAAPELYDMLQSLVEYVDRECIPCGETACELMAAAHNVLAKAAGESDDMSK